MSDTKELATARDIGEAILALPQKPMDRDMTEALVRISLTEASGGFTLPPFSIEVCKKRLAYHGISAADSVVALIGLLSDRPGTIVLYCAAVKALADRNNRQPVTLDDFVHGFAMGFPTDDDLMTVWDRQKVRDGKQPDNWLDREEAWR